MSKHEEVVRERQTEQKVRRLDTSDIVWWIHELENYVESQAERVAGLASELKHLRRFRDNIAKINEENGDA